VKLALVPRRPAWRMRLVTVALLVTGLAGFTVGFAGAVAGSLAQTFWCRQQAGRIQAISVQIRLPYALPPWADQQADQDIGLSMNLKVVPLIYRHLQLSGSWPPSRSERTRTLSMNRGAVGRGSRRAGCLSSTTRLGSW
jgi:hypothetical protein